MLKTLAIIFGVVLLLVGILGFVPSLTENGKLFGIAVDTAHNLIHLLTGAAALWWGTSEAGARRFFQTFGIIYAAVALLGFFYGESELLGFMAHNMMALYVHLLLAIVFLVLGYGTKRAD